VFNDSCEHADRYYNKFYALLEVSVAEKLRRLSMQEQDYLEESA